MIFSASSSVSVGDKASSILRSVVDGKSGSKR